MTDINGEKIGKAEAENKRMKTRTQTKTRKKTEKTRTTTTKIGHQKKKTKRTAVSSPETSLNYVREFCLILTRQRAESFGPQDITRSLVGHQAGPEIQLGQTFMMPTKPATKTNQRS